MSDMIIYSLICITGTFVASISQILLKKSATKKHKPLTISIKGKKLITIDGPLREYINAPVIFAYVIFFGATICTMYAYKVIPLSLGPILQSSGYIFIAILSWIFIKEKMTVQKIIGIATIIIGIAIYSAKF